MAKFRYINTKFWNDSFVVGLDPLEKFLFLYFLTNEHTNIAGIYELPLRVMAFETGIDKDMLPKMIEKFDGRIYYIEGRIFIKNFIKNQDTSSKDVKEGIKKIIRELPESVLEGVGRVMGLPEISILILISILIPKSISESKRVGRFAPPALQELTDYCLERKNGISPQGFIDFYESKGWFIGRNKMVSWKAAVRTWEKRDKEAEGKKQIANIDL